MFFVRVASSRKGPLRCACICIYLFREEESANGGSSTATADLRNRTFVGVYSAQVRASCSSKEEKQERRTILNLQAKKSFFICILCFLCQLFFEECQWCLIHQHTDIYIYIWSRARAEPCLVDLKLACISREGCPFLRLPSEAWCLRCLPS